MSQLRLSPPPALPDPPRIHPTAIVEPGAVIGEGTRIGPYTVIGGEVRLGRDNVVGPHVVIDGRTTLGDRNRIYQFASIGAAPQVDHGGEDAGALVIGDDNVIREYVTIQPGLEAGHPLTVVGSGALLMASSHVAHDCRVGDGVRLANAATLAGHVQVGDHAWLSGLTAVHQFNRVGAHAFVACGAIVVQDVPPFCMAQGDRARLIGLNEVGLRRHGFSAGDILGLRRAYKTLFRRPGAKAERMAAARAELGERRGVAELLDFLAETRRGVMVG
jgi:UDP-N-acetylglucosamine acyltransferase